MAAAANDPGAASGELAPRLVRLAHHDYPDGLLMSHTLPAALIDTLRARLGDRARPGESLARYTSFRIGGPADVLVLPDTREELAHALATAAAFGVHVTLLGGGSNVLVGDAGMRGVVVKLGRGFARIDWNHAPEAARGSARAGRRGLGASEERSAAPAARAPDGPPDESISIQAGAAAQLGRLARAAVAHGLAGLEYAEGIPGTVGGALFMNAGAYGGEVSEAVDAVEGVDASGTVHHLGRPDVAFTYRRAALPAGFIVTAVRFRLRPESPETIRVRLEQARERRTASQPPGDFAGRLVETAGLKGTRSGARASRRRTATSS